MPHARKTLFKPTPHGKKADVKSKNNRRSLRKSVKPLSTSLNYPTEYLSKSKQSLILDYQSSNSKLSNKKKNKTEKTHDQQTSEVKKLKSNTTKNDDSSLVPSTSDMGSERAEKSVDQTQKKRSKENSLKSRYKKSDPDESFKVVDTVVKSKARKKSDKNDGINVDKVKASISSSSVCVATDHNSQTSLSKTLTSQMQERSISNEHKSKTASAMTQKKRKKRKAVYEISPEMKKTKFYDNDVTKWQPLDQATNSYILGLVDSEIQMVLSTHFPRSEDVSNMERCLRSCRRKLSEKIKSQKVPRNGFGDYRKLNKLMADYKEILEKLNDQEQHLEEAVEQEEMDCIDLGKQESRLANVGKFEVLEAFNNYNPQLAIPKLPKFKAMLHK